ncbi:dimethylarginine dimethylaminohydrolase family protein [Planococcus beigongshangi]|uniref:dimethylarginine dimethylaminohydrolase family protein n=1 Tax=Planococcus beigongshangi TaxID=2782536 RepID=UPI00193B9D0B|nr:arginine deiminase family protein [Planococcus beigongshangi]
MTAFTKSSSARCRSEYDSLRRVLLCPPEYMEIKDVINDVQKRYLEENIDTEKAMRQHTEFIQALQREGVETDLLNPSETFPEQVFTRDIGFTVGETVYIAEMASEIRQGEENVLQKWLKHNKFQSATLGCNRVEGGDVLVDQDTVFVGVSSRTSEKAIEELQQKLPDYMVIPISFNEKYLHLDCVFNILSPTEALIYEEALDPDTVAMLSKRYTLIPVDAKEQFALGTNVLSIGRRRVFSQPQNVNVNSLLRANDFHVIEVDFSEIIKSGGAFRCCTLPLIREG